MASKRAKGGHSRAGDEKVVEDVVPTTTTVVAAPPLTPQKHDPIKVNNASLTDLKNACDDSIKKVRRSEWLACGPLLIGI